MIVLVNILSHQQKSTNPHGFLKSEQINGKRKKNLFLIECQLIDVEETMELEKFHLAIMMS